MSLDTEIDQLIAHKKSPPLTPDQVEVYKQVIKEYTQRSGQSIEWAVIIDRKLQEAGCDPETAFHYAFERSRFAGIASR